MPAKKGKKVGAGKRNQLQPRPIRGAGQWRQNGRGLWDWIKGAAGTIGNAAKDVFQRVPPSSILGLIPHPYAQGPAAVLKQAGLGRRRITRL